MKEYQCTTCPGCPLMKGKHCKEYDGIVRDLNELAVGDKFHVQNGLWFGEIVEVEGVKSVKNPHGVFPLTGTFTAILSK